MIRAGRWQNAGYTILETMIFLVVTAAMFVSMMAFISGRQNRTEFNSGIRDFESNVNDIANDVSNGYYANVTSSANPSGQKISCVKSGTGVMLSNTTSDEQGKNEGCIFIGKALQFNSTDEGTDKFVTVSLVGKQYKNNNAAYGDVTTYQESGVRAIAKESSGDLLTPDAYGSSLVGTGLTVTCAVYATAAFSTPPASPCSSPVSGLVPTDTIAFMTTFNAASLDTSTRNNSAAVNLVVPTAMSQASPRSIKQAVYQINRYTDAVGVTNIVINPPGGVYICLQSGGTNQYALVSLGGQSNRFSTNTTVRSGKC